MMPGVTTPLLSVVVCTYNRAELLTDALRTLVAQALAPEAYEIIVVDNRSEDDTRSRVQSLVQEQSNLRYAFEPEQGLSHARNRGWQLARGDYVGYVDDDCRVPEHWTGLAARIAQESSPAAFGGPYYPFFGSSRPTWFLDRYGSHVQGSIARFLQQDEFLDGMNFFVRRTVLDRLGGFDPRLGMSGGEIGYGEETALQMRIRELNGDHSIFYHPELYLHHLVPERKMALLWIVRQRFADGRYAFRVFRRIDARRLGICGLTARGGVALLRLAWDLCLGLFRRDRGRYPHIQNHLYEISSRHIQTLGQLFEAMRSVVRDRNPGDDRAVRRLG
jgi:glucosyl-dolichyl phosphate glucuronosyltransferase